MQTVTILAYFKTNVHLPESNLFPTPRTLKTDICEKQRSM